MRKHQYQTTLNWVQSVTMARISILSERVLPTSSRVTQLSILWFIGSITWYFPLEPRNSSNTKEIHKSYDVAEFIQKYVVIEGLWTDNAEYSCCCEHSIQYLHIAIEDIQEMA